MARRIPDSGGKVGAVALLSRRAKNLLRKSNLHEDESGVALRSRNRF